MTTGAVETEASPTGAAPAGAVKPRWRRSDSGRGVQRRQALVLVLPLLLFLLATFVFPIARLLWLSVHDPLVGDLMPRTTAALAAWDGRQPVPEPVVTALVEELREAHAQQMAGQLAARLNHESAGMRSLILKTARQAKGFGPPPYRERLTALDPAWSGPEPWAVIRRLGAPVTPVQLLAAVDHRIDAAGSVVPVEAERRIHGPILLRTALIALLVTGICLLLGYPVAHLLATVPPRIGNLLMVIVLLPLWTSILVRCAAWIVLLQTNGVVNELLVAAGLVGEGGRPELIFNMTGTIVAMTHVLLPYMILPLYSTMRAVPPAYMRAARSLGAGPLQGFFKVYLPLTLPGVGAGSILVFILAIGYYVTPALVGGSSGTLISNIIAYHMQSSLNWGLAAALSALLLVGVLALYALYSRIVGLKSLSAA